VVIPKLYNGHNRTFFFGSGKHALRDLLDHALLGSDSEMKNGDFRGPVDAQGRQIKFTIQTPRTSHLPKAAVRAGVANTIDPARSARPPSSCLTWPAIRTYRRSIL
jgi:hypothetical protein